MGMSGPGQIAELARIAKPDVGVIVSIGPVHLELLGTIDAVAAAKAELIAALPPSGTAVVPAGETLLEPHLRPDVETVRFGPGGDVTLAAEGEDWAEIDLAGERIRLSLDFTQAHLRTNLLAGVAAARAIGVTPGGSLHLRLSPGRGQHLQLQGGITLIDDAYNANPMSMRAALNELTATAKRLHAGRRVAVLGDMLELGPDGARFHADVGAHANGNADVLVTVGPLAAAMAGEFQGEHRHVADAAGAAELVPGLLRDGDVVLVKASNGVGLKLVCETLSAGAPA
jgi:UDP-N-acetylmuramoyl-tripeptide--D-alanyl-D-alanine ligase